MVRVEAEDVVEIVDVQHFCMYWYMFKYYNDAELFAVSKSIQLHEGVVSMRETVEVH